MSMLSRSKIETWGTRHPALNFMNRATGSIPDGEAHVDIVVSSHPFK